MKAKVSENSEFTVVHLMGQIHYESVGTFRETCRQKFHGKEIIFNLHGLNFVGSTGITPFMETIQEMASNHPRGVKLCHVSSEFKKIIAAQEIGGLEIFEDQRQAENSYLQSVPVATTQPVIETASKPQVILPITENRPWDDLKVK